MCATVHIRARHSMTKRVGLWLPPLIYMGLIFHYSSQSNPLPEMTRHVWDKLLHTAEYAGLAVLLCRALLGEGVGGFRAFIIAIVLTAVYGASDEWHQSFVPLRAADVRDWLADDLGAMAGAAAYSMASGRRQRDKPQRPGGRARDA